MSINSITTTSSQSLSIASSIKTSDNLEYQATLNEALNAELSDNQNTTETTNLSTSNAQNGSLEYQSYSYTQTTISFYQASSVNSSSLSTLLSQTTNSEDSTSLNGINATKPSEYGYNVDDNGFFGSDFNKAARLPASFRVNIKMMETATEYSSVSTEHATPMQVFARSWELFQEVCESKLNMDKDGYISMQDARNLPKGYTMTGVIFDKLLSVHNTPEEFSAECDKYATVQEASNATFVTGLAQFIYVDADKKDFDERVKSGLGTYYGDNAPEGKVAVGELFAAYFNTNVDQEAGSYVGVPMARAFYNFLDGNQSFSSYSKSQYTTEDVEKMLKYYGDDYFTKLDDLAQYFKGLLMDSLINVSGKQDSIQ